MTLKKSILLFFVLTVTLAWAAERRPAYVVLTTPCLAEHFRATPDAARPVRQRLFEAEADNYRSVLRRGKADLATRIAARGIPIDGQTETILNAIYVQATDDDLVWLRNQPGVESAEFGFDVRMNLDTALPLVGVPQVWASLGGEDNAGRGIKIAMIDSGIDTTHPMFSDAGFTAPSGFPKTDATRPGDLSLTNNKVIVVRNFNSTSAEPDSRDHVGHGTFGAAVAAGRRATGPLANIAGVAPGAYLGSYKVFTTEPSVSVTVITRAMDQAVVDGMDIINLSLGTQNAPLPSLDPNLRSVLNAVGLNIVVVAAAGNCGPNGSSDCKTVGSSTIGSPGTLPDVLTAGASTNARTFNQPVRVTAPAPVPAALQLIPSLPGSAPSFVSNVGPAAVADITTFDSTALGCSTFPAGSMAGKIALILRGTCDFTVKVANAGQAGAIGVVIYDSKPEDLFTMDTTGASLPSVLITQADGLALKAFSAANPGAVQVTIDAKLVAQAVTADQVANFSSRGPSTDRAIKPDVMAPGENIYSAAQNLDSTGDLYAVSRFALADGTSFSAPLMSGAVAILEQARPSLKGKVRAIKSALVNTATPLTATQDGAPISVMNSGAGKLNMPAAMATTLVADPVSVSFGLQSPVAVSGQQTVTFTNIGTQSETFTVAVAPRTIDTAVKAAVTPSSLTLAAGSSAPVTISLAGTPVSAVYEGFINLRSQSTSTSINVPYWVGFSSQVSTGGVVNSATFKAGASPGAILALFGSALGGDAALAPSLPLPSTLGISTVKVNGTAVPLFYTSGSQVNIQLPFTVSASSGAAGQVTTNGTTGQSFTISVTDAAPGIFTIPSGGTGAGAIVHAIQGGLVTRSSPAAAGEIVSIYCTGLGVVTTPPAAGAATPISPLSTTPALPVVTIGGQPATVMFSGLAPTFAGLYQINVVVPRGLPSGEQTVSVSMGGVVGNSVTMTVQ